MKEVRARQRVGLRIVRAQIRTRRAGFRITDRGSLRVISVEVRIYSVLQLDCRPSSDELLAILFHIVRKQNETDSIHLTRVAHGTLCRAATRRTPQLQTGTPQASGLFADGVTRRSPCSRHNRTTRMRTDKQTISGSLLRMRMCMRNVEGARAPQHQRQRCLRPPQLHPPAE